MISFVIPTFNEERAIVSTLKMLKRCTRFAFEIIVTDDRSTDATVEIARQYADMIVIRDEGVPQTIAANRNRGAAKARGEFVAFIDSGVTVENPDVFFESALKFFETDPKLTALTGFLKVLPVVATRTDTVISAGLNWLFFIFNTIVPLGATSGKFMMVRKDAFAKIGGFRESLVVAEDQDLFRRLARIGHTRCQPSLVFFHTARRAHALGWPRLLWIWAVESVWMTFFGRSFNKVWKDIR